ncbi:hypothetical protein GGX14DRAFT_373003 [Mycena pura]|uniref:HMG box domain-containing protein n=1 Tax=Mycena pura TaxID=153505 RepID=A0AAD6V4Y9_9AGAR|nr:hypothetical protein GGX14DRAFT_373003 [Mycena pura]
MGSARALDGPEERRPKRGDEDYVPRPPNPFMLFRSWYCWYWKWRRQPGVNLNDAASREWNAFSPEERAPWEALAKEKKKEHETLYPNYKYKPQSRSANSHVSASGSTTAPRSNQSTSSVSASPPYRPSQNANEASLQDPLFLVLQVASGLC